MSKTTQPKFSGQVGDRLNKNYKQEDIRKTNIQAAKAVAEVVRTSLGPRGMDKMIMDSKGEVLITNDGATIMKQMELVHPTARMLVEISKAQDIEAGDGTTSVVVMAGSMLNQSLLLLDKGVHPSHISEGFQMAIDKAKEILQTIAKPLELTDKSQLINCVNTCLSSKVVNAYSDVLSPLAVEAVLKVVDITKDFNVDLNQIKIAKKLGGTVEDTMLVDGLCFSSQKVSHYAGGPSRLEKPKIALVQFCISAPKTDMENSVVVKDYSAMDRILKEERKYIAEIIKKIVKSGANVVLIQKSILRESVNQLALHFLAKKGIMVVRDIERDDVAFISKTIGCIPVSHIDHLTPEKLGTCNLVEEKSLSDDSKVLMMTGVDPACKTVTIFMRGSNQLVLDEADRSIHDALCVVRSLVKSRSILCGGGAPEIEIAQKLAEWSRTLSGVESLVVKAYADALEAIPETLAENSGLNTIQVVTELRNRHMKGEKYSGISLKKFGILEDMHTENVIQPTLITESALTLSTECVRMILKIDDLVISAR